MYKKYLDSREIINKLLKYIESMKLNNIVDKFIISTINCSES